jgi:hypothetical protein
MLGGDLARMPLRVETAPRMIPEQIMSADGSAGLLGQMIAFGQVDILLYSSRIEPKDLQ